MSGNATPIGRIGMRRAARSLADHASSAFPTPSSTAMSSCSSEIQQPVRPLRGLSISNGRRVLKARNANLRRKRGCLAATTRPQLAFRGRPPFESDQVRASPMISLPNRSVVPRPTVSSAQVFGCDVSQPAVCKYSKSARSAKTSAVGNPGVSGEAQIR